MRTSWKQVALSTCLLVSTTTATAQPDPLFHQQWGLENLGNNGPTEDARQGFAGADLRAKDAWKISEGSKKVIIAIMDDGVDYHHEDLAENIWTNSKELNGLPGVDDDGNGHIDDIHGYDFVHNDSDPFPDPIPEKYKDHFPYKYLSHGTMVASVIAAVHNNGKGMKGIVPNASIMILKTGGFPPKDRKLDPLDVHFKAMDYAVRNGAKIINYSAGLGRLHENSNQSRRYFLKLKELEDKGVIFVNAVNNYNLSLDALPDYPTSFAMFGRKNVITVASHTSKDVKDPKSGYGKDSVHIFAPGKDIVVAAPGNKYTVESGNSLAAPYVAGAIGLYYSKHGYTDNVEKVREMLMATSTKRQSYKDYSLSSGRLNLKNFLNQKTQDPIPPYEWQWVDSGLDIEWESKHPYERGKKQEKIFSVPGARYIRLVFSKFQLVQDKVFRSKVNADFLKIYNADQKEVAYYSISRSNLKTLHVKGDTLIAKLLTERRTAKTGWGFKLDKVQVIW